MLGSSRIAWQSSFVLRTTVLSSIIVSINVLGFCPAQASVAVGAFGLQYTTTLPQNQPIVWPGSPPEPSGKPLAKLGVAGLQFILFPGIPGGLRRQRITRPGGVIARFCIINRSRDRNHVFAFVRVGFRFICRSFSIRQRRFKIAPAFGDQPAPEIIEAIIRPATVDDKRDRPQIPPVTLRHPPPKFIFETQHRLRAHSLKSFPNRFDDGSAIIAGFPRVFYDLPEFVSSHRSITQ